MYVLHVNTVNIEIAIWTWAVCFFGHWWLFRARNQLFRQHRRISLQLLRLFCFVCKSELGQRPASIMGLSQIAIAFSCHHNADDLSFASHNNEHAVSCLLQQSKSFSRVLLNYIQRLSTSLTGRALTNDVVCNMQWETYCNKNSYYSSCYWKSIEFEILKFSRSMFDMMS